MVVPFLKSRSQLEACLLSPFLNPYWEPGIERGLYWHLLGLLESTNVLVSALEMLFVSCLTTLRLEQTGAFLKSGLLVWPISHQPMGETEVLKALLASTWSVWAM